MRSRLTTVSPGNRHSFCKRQMIKISNDQATEKLLASLKGLFSQGQAFLLAHQHLSFVCGAREDPSKDVPLRKLFLDYLECHDGGNTIRPILAEQTIEEFLGAKRDAALELGKFEKLIADCVDSIVIFPESPGSFAELGFFAATPEVLKKSLIANHEENQGNSFINLGLMPFYNRDSVYKPMIIIGANQDFGFAQIKDRLLLNNSGAKYRKRFPIDDFKTLNSKHKLIVLHELIRAFGYIREEHLFQVLPLLFKSYDLSDVHRLLAILVAMRYVSRNEYGDYVIKNDAPGLLEYSHDLFDKARAQVMLFYRKHDPDAYVEMTKL